MSTHHRSFVRYTRKCGHGWWGTRVSLKERSEKTALYLVILGLLAYDKHSHWTQLHPWTAWFVILVLAAVADLFLHRSYVARR